MKAAVLFAVTGFSAIASAALATINPCPSCPATAKPSKITVTSQYQPVSTCTPSQTCTTDTADISASTATLTCRLEPDCTTYTFVSTVIPFLAGSSSTTVTEIDAIVTLDHTSTVLTSLIPITTKAPVLPPIINGTLALQNVTFTNYTYTLTKYETLIVDTWCPYNQMGPLAVPGYDGSGLCKSCTAKPGLISQVVTVRDCHDNSTCGITTKTWISKLPIATSSSQVAVSTRTALPSGGTYVIPVVTVCEPYDSHYYPVTKSFAVTTAVYYPTIIQITKIIDITFIGYPAPTATTTLSECPLTTSTYCPTNGIHTVPMVTTVYPTLPGYGSPIIIDIDITITVINAPTIVFPSTIIIVTLTSAPTTVTVISGTTVTTPVTTTVTTTTTESGGVLPIPGSETTDTFTATETFTFSETESISSTATESATFTETESTSTFTETESTSTFTETESTFTLTETESTSTFTETETTSSFTEIESTFTFTESESTTIPVVSSTITESETGTFTITETASASASIILEAQDIEGFSFLGCYGSPAGLQDFDLQSVDDNMTPEICANRCRNAGFPYSGTYQTECYCAESIDPATQTSDDVCGLSCPGDPRYSCGNNSSFRKLRARLVNPSKLLDVYQFIGFGTSTTTSFSATETTFTTESTETISTESTETTSSFEPTETTFTTESTETISTELTETISTESTETTSTLVIIDTTSTVESDTTTATESETTSTAEPASTTDFVEVTSTFNPSPTTNPGPDSTTSEPSSVTSDPPLPLSAFELVGCLGSSNGFPTFDFQFTDLNMSPALCANSCRRDGLGLSGLYNTDCYCAASLGSGSAETGSGVCNIPCPGDPTLTCGGNIAQMLRARDVPRGRVLDVYQYPPLSPTTTTLTSDQFTTEIGSMTSDGPEPTLEPRALDADMELASYKHRVRQLRRGGMLRGEKRNNANLRVKRNFGMRNPFGL